MNNLNKILFILHFPPPIHGSSLMGGYIKESKRINEAFNCQYINLGTSVTIEEIGAKKIRKIFRYVLIHFKVLYKLITFKPKFCYVAITAKGFGFYKDSLIVLLIKLFGVRLVYHFHNKGINSRQSMLIDNFLYRIVFKNASAILLSKYLYFDIQKYIPENKVYYCANGVEEWSSNGRQKKINKYNNVKILFLSNLMESKGVFVLLEACKILKYKKLDFNCTFIGGEGDINEKKFKEKVLEFELLDYVKYIGVKLGKEKVNEFIISDIFVLPTMNDCFPLVLLEAMQFSLPVVSTFEGGIPEIVEDYKTGFLIPPADSKLLAERIESLIINPKLRRELGLAGHSKYLNEFTLRIFERNLYSILKKL
jgi:glycosyltransferase involved in cell wall biosynthesis